MDDLMHIAEVRIAADDDFGALLQNMRLWLDGRGFEPSTFIYHCLNSGMSIEVSFKFGEEAEAFARRFGGSLQHRANSAAVSASVDRFRRQVRPYDKKCP
jgi:hypothetical protein